MQSRRIARTRGKAVQRFIVSSAPVFVGVQFEMLNFSECRAVGEARIVRLLKNADSLKVFAWPDQLELCLAPTSETFPGNSPTQSCTQDLASSVDVADFGGIQHKEEQ